MCVVYKYFTIIVTGLEQSRIPSLNQCLPHYQFMECLYKILQCMCERKREREWMSSDKCFDFVVKGRIAVGSEFSWPREVANLKKKQDLPGKWVLGECFAMDRSQSTGNADQQSAAPPTRTNSSVSCNTTTSGTGTGKDGESISQPGKRALSCTIPIIIIILNPVSCVYCCCCRRLVGWNGAQSLYCNS